MAAGGWSMTKRTTDSDGLGLVEVVVAMLLLAVIALAMLPSLWEGVSASSRQSATATATRHLYALIEDARSTPDCDTLDDIASSHAVPDGRGSDISITSTYVPADCVEGTAVFLTLAATDATGKRLAGVAAQIYVPDVTP
jgi:Tfp pilus assembly protein PilV